MGPGHHRPLPHQQQAGADREESRVCDGGLHQHSQQQGDQQDSCSIQMISIKINIQVVTVFSAPNYCDVMSNLGAVVIVQGSNVLSPVYRVFDYVAHPL